MMKRAPTFFEQKRAQEMLNNLRTAETIFAEIKTEIEDLNHYDTFNQALTLRNLPENEAKLVLCVLTKHNTTYNSMTEAEKQFMAHGQKLAAEMKARGLAFPFVQSLGQHNIKSENNSPSPTSVATAPIL